MHLNKSKLSITKRQWQHLFNVGKDQTTADNGRGSIAEFRSIAEPVLGIEIYGSDPFEVRPTGRKIAAPTFCLLTVFHSFLAVWVFFKKNTAVCLVLKHSLTLITTFFFFLLQHHPSSFI